MNCEEIQERLSMMLDEELSGDERALIMEHITACPECMKVYEAFSSVSDSLKDLEDVPEGFTEDVMHRIYAKNAAPKRKRYFAGVLGMAACLALVLFAGRTVDPPQSRDMNGLSAINADAAAPTVEDAVPYTYGNGGLDAELMSFDTATVYQNSYIADPDAPTVNGTIIDVDDGTPDTECETATEKAANRSSISNTVAPESLDTILTAAVPAEYGNYERTADYTVVFSGENETYFIDVWVEGERLYCQDAAGNAYYAEGTYAQLLTLMNE